MRGLSPQPQAPGDEQKGGAQMKAPDVAPRDLPREFGAGEMFFSTTDPRGVITAGNEVFVRVSGYGATELVGRAHNVIRHPDMPRAAFRLVWSYLKQSRRVAALVKNLAKDGGYYWVVALFVPAPDGFLSIRFKPTGPAVDALKPTYAAMLAEEERQLASGADDDTAMNASAALLAAAVRARGYADYDAFMRALLCDELKSRDNVLRALGLSVVPALPAGARPGPDDAALHTLFRHGETAYAKLSRLFVRLDEFVALQAALEDKAVFVENLTRELRLAAVNAALASTRVGAEAQSLGVVSHYMGSASGDVAGAVGALTTGIRTVSKRLRSVVFNLAVGRLEIEMIMIFLHELIATPAAARKNQHAPRSITTLQHIFRASLERASTALDELESGARQLSPASANLGRHMLELQVAQLTGVVETTRLADKGDFVPVFGHIRQLIEDTRGQLNGLGDTLAQLDAIAVETPAAAREIASHANDMHAQAAVLAAA